MLYILPIDSTIVNALNVVIAIIEAKYLSILYIWLYRNNHIRYS